MTFAQIWHRFLGVRPTEATTVWLFFLHNFCLGIGTILVYVSANVILLENHPLTSLPIAYIVAAPAMMLVGRIYSHFEHHLLLKQLAVRVLLSVIALMFVLGILVFFGHSVIAAVAIMAGYRMIYLLTNLEFWGVSAVVFDVRQSKRLFSVISSGDMPAKALGALLSVIVHAHTELVELLLIAFVAFVAAMYVLRRTVQTQAVDVVPARIQSRRPTSPILQQLFGGSELVFFMCISLAAIACVVTSIEYFFFVNVKEKFHHEADVMQFIGLVLVATYLSALVFKLLFSWKTFERIGIRWSLAALPIAGLIGILVFIAMQNIGVSETSFLAYFCGLYLLLEVLRRAVFDPIFLVLFQPLTPTVRLKGHTLVKGFYEPLGMGLTGLFLIGFSHMLALPFWFPFAWMTLFTGLALYFLSRTYQAYLDTLKNALERRFIGNDDLILPTTARHVIIDNLQSTTSADVLNAVDWLGKQEPAMLAAQSANLLQHTDSSVRSKVLNFVGNQIAPSLLLTLAATDPEPGLRQSAARWLARRANVDEYLNTIWQKADLPGRTGAIQGRLETASTDAVAQGHLTELLAAKDYESHKAALSLLPFLPQTQQRLLVKTALASQNNSLQQAAIESAGSIIDQEITPAVIALLTAPTLWRSALQSQTKGGAAVIPYLKWAITPNASRLLVQRIAIVCGRIDTPESAQFLLELAEGPNLFWRAAALHALRNFLANEAFRPRFQTLLENEFALAQRFIHAVADNEANPALISSLDYELMLLQQRVFGLLMQLYDTGSVVDAQRGVLHAARDRKANALEMLDNLIPQPIYRSLQTLVDDVPMTEKQRLLGKFMGDFADTEPIHDFVLRQGEACFSDWTISVVLRHADAFGTNESIQLALPYLQSTNPLLQESAKSLFLQLPSDTYDRYPIVRDYAPTIMKHAQTAHILLVDRVVAIKQTALFASTPENVLSSVARIMQEVTYHEGQTIFEKGEIGSSLFIIYEGEVGIFDGREQLATFGKGGFFGELALLDTEPRSATATALAHTLAFRIDQEDFYDLMEERGEVLQNIVRALCQRLRRQNELLHSSSAAA